MNCARNFVRISKILSGIVGLFRLEVVLILIFGKKKLKG
jgi:hypothetical protein